MDLAAERDIRPKLSAATQPGIPKGTLVQLGESTIRILCGKCNKGEVETVAGCERAEPSI